MTLVKPTLTLLHQDQIKQIHRYSLDILSSTGIRVDSKAALELFSQFSCKIKNNRQVLIERDLVAWALKAAPAAIDVWDRLGRPCFTLGRSSRDGAYRSGSSRNESDPVGSSQTPTRFGIGVTNLHFQDALTDRVLPFTVSHTASAVRLGHALEQFDVISTPGIVQDLAPEAADLHSSLAMAANTTKPLVLLVSEYGLFEPVLDMLTTLNGRLDRKPFVIPYVNPITPLVLNAETADKMILTIGRKLPLIYSSFGMSGATTPITPGGTMALLNAELLAGIVFSQIVREGAPIIAGCLPAGFDMQSMISTYTPHTMLLNLACAEMMNHYGIPHSGTSGSGPGWGPDLPAGGGFWINHLTGLMGKVGLAPFVGGNFDSLVFSPAAVVYAGEVIRAARMFCDGFSIDADQVGLDEIRSLGSAGNYLAAPSTYSRFREFEMQSPVWPKYSLDQWLDRGCPRAGKLLREYTRHLLTSAKPPPDHDELMEKGRRFISRLSSSRL